MAAMEWDRIPDEYMYYFLLDLAYVDLQPDLFRYLFPACLKFWYDTLMRNHSAELGDSELHYALIRGGVAEKMLSPDEQRALNEFFCDGFLDRAEQERWFLYDKPKGDAANSWIFRHNSLGILAPVIPSIWTQ